MGYIGNEPTTGHFPVQTNLVGPGPTYTLTRAPATAGAIEVSVQGVLQPTTAYSVSGTTLTMAGVASGIPLFIRYLGETLSLPIPADGSVVEAKIANDAVTSAKIANDAVISAKIATDAVTIAKLAATGTASSSTFLRGDNAWAAAGGGAWTHIQTQVASAVASVTFTGLTTTYNKYVLVGSDITATADGNSLQFQMGDSGGIDTGGSDYAFHLSRSWQGGTAYAGSASAGASQMEITGGIGNATGENGSFVCYITGMNGNERPLMHGTWIAMATSSDIQQGSVGGQRKAVITLDRVLLKSNSGTISGDFSLYGIAIS